MSKEINTYADCPICGAVRSTFIDLSKGPQDSFGSVVCDQCGYASREPRPSFDMNLDLQLDAAKAHAVVPHHKMTRWPHRPALIAAQIQRYAGKKGVVLDIGCSNGLNLLALAKGWEKHGVELCPTAATSARELCGIDVFYGPYEQYRPPIPEFDLITAFALIEHLHDPVQLVEWVHSHLSKGGLFVLMTGDRQSRTASVMGKHWPLYHCADHVSYFSARSIRCLARKCGFQVLKEEWRYMYFPGERRGRVLSCLMKLEEICGLVRRPVHDHYYCYLRK